jgi:hypothetical protein
MDPEIARSCILIVFVTENVRYADNPPPPHWTASLNVRMIGSPSGAKPTLVEPIRGSYPTSKGGIRSFVEKVYVSPYIPTNS